MLLNEDFCKVLLNPLTALTAVQIDLSDAGMTQLAEESQEAAMAGWSGKQVIHPKQVSSLGLPHQTHLQTLSAYTALPEQVSC